MHSQCAELLECHSPSPAKQALWPLDHQIRLQYLFPQKHCANWFLNSVDNCTPIICNTIHYRSSVHSRKPSHFNFSNCFLLLPILATLCIPDLFKKWTSKVLFSTTLLLCQENNPRGALLLNSLANFGLRVSRKKSFTLNVSDCSCVSGLETRDHKYGHHGNYSFVLPTILP